MFTLNQSTIQPHVLARNGAMNPTMLLTPTVNSWYNLFCAKPVVASKNAEQNRESSKAVSKWKSGLFKSLTSRAGDCRLQSQSYLRRHPPPCLGRDHADADQCWKSAYGRVHTQSGELHNGESFEQLNRDKGSYAGQEGAACGL